MASFHNRVDEISILWNRNMLLSAKNNNYEAYIIKNLIINSNKYLRNLYYMWNIYSNLAKYVNKGNER